MSKWFVSAFVALAAVAAVATPVASGATAGTPTCSPRGLVIWIPSGQGAAGSFYYTLDFTNQSGKTCTLRGYPGVSAVNLGGRQIGSAAGRNNATKVRTITLRNGATASTTLRIVNTGALPASCAPTNAAGVRVFPPNGRTAKIVPLPFKACSKKISFMSVRAVK